MTNAVSAVNEQRVVSLTQQLVHINSEYSEDGVREHYKITRFLKGLYESVGMEVHYAEPEKGFPIVVARLRGKTGKPVLGFIGHYNTVLVGDRSKWSVDPLGGEVKDGRIWGRGSGDMKRSIAATIEATRAVMESRTELKGDLLHIWFAGEGHHSSALEYMAGAGRAYAGADWYVDTDSDANIGKVASSMVWLQLRSRGLTGHTGLFRGDGGKPVNAVSKMVRLLCRIEQVDDWMTYKTHPLFGKPWRYSTKPIVEIGRISGGVKVNQIPEVCIAEVDFRLLPGQTVERFLNELRSLIEKVRGEDSEFEPVDIKPIQIDSSRPWELTEEHPVVKVIHEIAPSILGRKPEFRGLGFGSRPSLWEFAEVIHFGVPGGANAHAPDESTSIDGLIKGTKVYAAMIKSLLG
jgi:succinyl-diaminopimelate desuccinylase